MLIRLIPINVARYMIYIVKQFRILLLKHIFFSYVYSRIMFQIYIIIALVIITLLIIIILTFQHDSNVYNWFQHDAEMINKPLHIRSGWGYLSEKHFNELVT